MTTSHMYDAAWPPAHPPAWPVVAGYLGGDTPHVWSLAEWEHQPARYRLPIWVRDNPGAVDPARDAAAAVTAAHHLGVPRGATIALDFETAVNAAYVRAFDKIMTAAGYGVILYGSETTVHQNPRPSRGYWVADWTNSPHMTNDANATQYAGSGPAGGAYDASLVATSLPLWDARPPAAPPAAAHEAALSPTQTNYSPEAQMARAVWNTDGVYHVPPEWNNGQTNSYWMPSSVLTYAVQLLREVRDLTDKIAKAQHLS